jgi:hypothetical protein
VESSWRLNVWRLGCTYVVRLPTGADVSFNKIAHRSGQPARRFVANTRSDNFECLHIEIEPDTGLVAGFVWQVIPDATPRFPFGYPVDQD